MKYTPSPRRPASFCPPSPPLPSSLSSVTLCGWKMWLWAGGMKVESGACSQIRPICPRRWLMGQGVLIGQIWGSGNVAFTHRAVNSPSTTRRWTALNQSKWCCLASISSSVVFIFISSSPPPPPSVYTCGLLLALRHLLWPCTFFVCVYLIKWSNAGLDEVQLRVTLTTVTIH